MRDDNCWEFLNCPDEIKEKCHAFKFESGDECWFLHDGKCELNNTSCLDCEWFIKKNS